jgi:hypothetical protein
MDKLKNLFLKGNKYQLVLIVLFVLYILLDIKTPENLAYLFDNMFGQIVVILGALALFLNSHPVVGVLGFFVAYELIRRSSISTGTYAVQKYVPTEETKADEMVEMNTPYTKTVEEEVIDNMIPLVGPSDNSTPSYKPVLDDNIESSKL